MYYELRKFSRHILYQKEIWTDGELWTAALGALFAYFVFSDDHLLIMKLRRHFGDLLKATSIIFGFTLSAMLFYIQASAAWAKDTKVASKVGKIVDWHTWTIVCMLFLIGYILALWSFGCFVNATSQLFAILHAVLVFMILYCGFQILNHALTVWWFYKSAETTGAAPN